MHFDIMTNVILRYQSSKDVDKIAGAMVGAVIAFEQDRARYLTQLTRELSPDATALMRWYGLSRCGKLQDFNGSVVTASLHESWGIGAFLSSQTKFKIENDVVRLAAGVRYQLALRELLERRLIWTHYVVDANGDGSDAYSGRGTRLGWMFLEHNWPALTCPTDEFSS